VIELWAANELDRMFEYKLDTALEVEHPIVLGMSVMVQQPENNGLVVVERLINEPMLLSDRDVDHGNGVHNVLLMK